jgi:hypothetical protein
LWRGVETTWKGDSPCICAGSTPTV